MVHKIIYKSDKPEKEKTNIPPTEPPINKKKIGHSEKTYY